MRKWIPFLIVIAAITASAVVYPKLPETMATHWDMDGQANGWSSRFVGAFITPLLMLAVWGFLRVLPAIDPRGSNYLKFGDAFQAIVVSIMFFLLAMHIFILRAALGYPVALQRGVPLGIGVLLVVIGNLLPRARPNWFLGIRTPWTLSSDRVWEKTHRAGGQMFVGGGILIILAAIVIPQWAHFVLITVVVACSLGAAIYSYVEWKREQTPASAG
ncbi:MAG: SdpI family protein [Gemmatimonadaceae bacterium]